VNVLFFLFQKFLNIAEQSFSKTGENGFNSRLSVENLRWKMEQLEIQQLVSYALTLECERC